MVNAIAEWADYSAGYPGAAALRAAGFSGAVRYIGLGTGSKLMTAAEYRDFEANNFDFHLVAEYDTHDAEHGYATGRANAHIAVDDARAKGIPDIRPNGKPVGIASAADEHLYGGTIQVGVDYARGFHDGRVESGWRGPTGCYGCGEVVRACQSAGVGQWYWQAGAESDVGPGVHLYQWNNGTRLAGGIQCDINKLIIPIGDTGEIDLTPEQNDVLHAILFELQGPKNPDGTLRGFDTVAGPRTVAAGVIEAVNALRTPLKSGVAGSTFVAEPGVYARNADAYGYTLTKAVADLAAKVQAPAPAVVDIDAVATAVAAKIGDVLAAKVADVLHDRLAQ